MDKMLQIQYDKTQYQPACEVYPRVWMPNDITDQCCATAGFKPDSEYSTVPPYSFSLKDSKHVSLDDVSFALSQLFFTCWLLAL